MRGLLLGHARSTHMTCLFSSGKTTFLWSIVKVLQHIDTIVAGLLALWCSRICSQVISRKVQELCQLLTPSINRLDVSTCSSKSVCTVSTMPADTVLMCSVSHRCRLQPAMTDVAK